MSKHEQDADLRLCRLDGRKPTMREKWTAFHRLWRIANGHGAEQDMAVGWAIRTLFPNWGWVKLLDSDGATDGLVDRSHIPKFLRKQLLEGVIRKRLRQYGGDAERDRVVARKVRDTHGIEVTPTEVAETRYKLMTLARNAAAELGIKPPDHIDELIRMMKRD